MQVLYILSFSFYLLIKNEMIANLVYHSHALLQVTHISAKKWNFPWYVRGLVVDITKLFVYLLHKITVKNEDFIIVGEYIAGMHHHGGRLRVFYQSV